MKEQVTRRDTLKLAAAGVAMTLLPAASQGAEASPSQTAQRSRSMSSYFKTKDGTDIFYKDWGSGRPLVFHHGWPLSSDDWDAQLMFFLSKGFRVIAHDRRGHGRSTQTVSGNEMDTYAADVAELAAHLDLQGAVHIGHSTGGWRGHPLRGEARWWRARRKGP